MATEAGDLFYGDRMIGVLRSPHPKMNGWYQVTWIWPHLSPGSYRGKKMQGATMTFGGPVAVPCR
jgi:hypothetical protein